MLQFLSCRCIGYAHRYRYADGIGIDVRDAEPVGRVARYSFLMAYESPEDV